MAIGLINQTFRANYEWNVADSLLAISAAPTLSSTAGGTIAATTYFVKVTYVTASGEIQPSAETSLAVALNNLLVVTSPAAPVAAIGATGYNVYVSTTTGTETKQNSTPIALGTNWTEPTSGLIVGASPPAAVNNTPDFENLYGVGIHLFINITAISGTGATLTVSLDEKDPISGTYKSILASAGLTATGLTKLIVNPGATVTANASANDFLPRTWRVSWTVTGTTPGVVATIGASISSQQGV